MNQFKNINGVWLTRELFFETAQNKENVLYTLKTEPHEGVHPDGRPFRYPSLYEAYMAANDVTEYSFAVSHLGGWAHWKLLSESTFFKSYLLDWREELEVRARSRALAKVIETAAGSTKDSFAAQKFVANKEWDKAKPAARGRPSNAQVKAAANDIAVENKRLTDDLNRLIN